MKKILILAFVLVIVTVGFSINRWNVLVTNNNTSIWRKAYTAATLDTTEWLATGEYEHIYLGLTAEDSASIHIYIQPVNRIDSILASPVLWDSLNTASNTGAAKTFDMTSAVAGYPYARFVFDGQVFRLGVTSAKYTASYMLKE
jgi:hypothetical protein